MSDHVTSIDGPGCERRAHDANDVQPSASSPVPSPVPHRNSAIARRKRDQRLRRSRRELLKVAPMLDDPKYAPLINSFCRVSLLAADGYELLRSGGLLDANGELRSSVATVNQLIGQQLKLARELGLSPSAVSKLKKDKLDLPAAFAEVEDAEQA
jgi:hypothetical protein